MRALFACPQCFTVPCAEISVFLADVSFLPAFANEKNRELDVEIRVSKIRVCPCLAQHASLVVNFTGVQRIPVAEERDRANVGHLCVSVQRKRNWRCWLESQHLRARWRPHRLILNSFSVSLLAGTPSYPRGDCSRVAGAP